MKSFLVLLSLLLLCGPALAQSTTWRVNGFTTTTTKRANPAWSYWYRAVSKANGSTLASGAVSGPNAVENGNNVMLVFPTISNAQRFRFTWGVGPIGQNPREWKESYDVNNPGSGTPPSGLYLPDGTPVSPGGDPVDENGNPILPEPKRYKATAEYTNPFDHPISLRITYYVEGAFFSTAVVNVQPKAKHTEVMVYHKPCSISLQPMADGVDFDDPIEAEGVPVYEDDPGYKPIPDGQAGGNGGPPLTAGGQRPGGGQQVASPSAQPDVARPGNSEGNADARNQELRGELQRIVAQLNTMGNQAANDADITNDLLDDIAQSAKKTAENTEGDGDGGGDGGGDGEGEGGMTVANDTLDGDDGIEGPGDEMGLGEKLGNIKSAGARLGEAFTAGYEALNLEGQYSESPLIWNIDTGRFGTLTINLEHFGTEVISLIRGSFLFGLSVAFVTKSIRIARSAFA